MRRCEQSRSAHCGTGHLQQHDTVRVINVRRCSNDRCNEKQRKHDNHLKYCREERRAKIISVFVRLVLKFFHQCFSDYNHHGLHAHLPVSHARARTVEHAVGGRAALRAVRSLLLDKSISCTLLTSRNQTIRCTEQHGYTASHLAEKVSTFGDDRFSESLLTDVTCCWQSIILHAYTHIHINA
jgi:hypothetical protein